MQTTPTQTESPALLLTSISQYGRKDLINLATKQVADLSESGEDILNLLALSAKLELFAGEVKRAAKAAGVDDLARYGRDGVAKAGVKLVLKDARVIYHYPESDPVLTRLESDLEAAANAVTAYKEVLKHLPGIGTIMNDDTTGELYKALPPWKEATPSIQATIL